MGELLRVSLLVAATLTTGLTAGLFAAFSYAVMPGLRRVDDRTFVIAMQRINLAILNRWFAAVFGGALLFIVVASAAHAFAGDWAILLWVTAALVLFGATLAVTAGGNVSLNDRLGASGEADQVVDISRTRAEFEAPWVRWNVVRAVTSTAAFACLAWALVLHERGIA